MILRIFLRRIVNGLRTSTRNVNIYCRRFGTTVERDAQKLSTQLLDDSNFWLQRKAISQTITLLESQLAEDETLAHEIVTLLHQYQPYPKNLLRIGIAGSPGAGKSTFLEALGQHMLQQSSQDARFAILCVDPSSAQTSGSILADKTRMPTLASLDRCFIRPCPSRTILGGLAPSTESVCRLVSALFPTVFVETVGLGQSEIDVQHVTDCVIYLVAPNSGDDLQAAKKGILEVVDAVVVTKADGNSLQAAKRTAGDFRGSVDVLGRRNRPVFLTSSVTGDGLAHVWTFLETLRNTPGLHDQRRLDQQTYWTRQHLAAAAVEQIGRRFDGLSDFDRTRVKDLPPRVAARRLLRHLWKD